MDTTVNIKMTVQDLDLLRRALESHRVSENNVVRDKQADPNRRNFARSEVVRTTDLINNLGGITGRQVP